MEIQGEFKVKKAILLVACLCLGLGIFGSSASAAGDSITVTNNFTAKWSKKITVASTGSFKYGFNTLLINEDFVHAFHPSKKINANLKNANGTHNASWNPLLGLYAAEVRHSGNTVTYSYSY